MIGLLKGQIEDSKEKEKGKYSALMLAFKVRLKTTDKHPIIHTIKRYISVRNSVGVGNSSGFPS